jgi:hypothetical protein
MRIGYAFVTGRGKILVKTNGHFYWDSNNTIVNPSFFQELPSVL